MREVGQAHATEFRRAMAPLVRVVRALAIAWAVVAASAASAATVVVLQAAGVQTQVSRALAAVVFLAAAGWAATTWSRRWTLVRVAVALERRAGGLDNLLVTAAEAATSPRRALHPVIADAVWRTAQARIAAAAAHAPTLTGPALLAASGLVAAMALTWTGFDAWSDEDTRGLGSPTVDEGTPGIERVDVRVTPPSYAGREAWVARDPEAIDVLAGSRVQVEVVAQARVEAIEPGQPRIELTRDDAVWMHAFTARDSRVLLLQQVTGGERAARLLHVRVSPDRPPRVRIETPGRDLTVPAARGDLAIEVTAEDDLALGSLVLRYTRVAGSGESFTFDEGEVPIATERAGATSWHGRARLELSRLQLEDGDTLVYRALARDAVPGREPSASESYVVEVGRLAGVASTGFAVPEERDRQAISQQMVIVKTERLHAERASLDATTALERSRLLAVEQRMVRAEFVFMTGCHVEDEVAEAEAGHEIAEGRLENQAQVDLLAAIREMSRAEARLNVGNTAEALVFERAALRALQRAFDRRRYLLRTLPERTRIDPSRRLTADRGEARAAAAAAAAPAPDPVAAAVRRVLAEFAAEKLSSDSAASLAARVIAVDPGHEALRQAAARLAAARTSEARQGAIEDAQRALAAILRSRIAGAPPGRLGGDALDGRVADALKKARP